MFHVSLPHSIVDLEALVTGRALEFSLDIGINSAILEENTEIMINALKESSLLVASFGL